MVARPGSGTPSARAVLKAGTAENSSEPNKSVLFQIEFIGFFISSLDFEGDRQWRGQKQNERKQVAVPCGLATAEQIGHCRRMELTLPAPLDARLSPQQTALHLAIGLFVTEEATLGQAAQVAGLSQSGFLRELGKRRIPIHYGAEELAADLLAVDSLAAR